MEGRRVINNIERSGFALSHEEHLLYSSRSDNAFLHSSLSARSPAQLSLISVLTIGIPSFVLALEPNKSLVRGHFMQNVLYRSLPAAFTNLFMVIGVLLFYLAFDIPKDEMSTICAVIMGIVGMLMLFTTSMPFNTIRRILFISMGALFIILALIMPDFFSLVPSPSGQG